MAAAAAPVYLDYNATAPLRPEALAAMTAALAETGNASSVHRYGRAARKRVEDARRGLAELLNCRAADLIFTSGGTEANNLAIRGAGRQRLLASAGEHDSVLALQGVETLPLSAAGLFDLDALEDRLAENRMPALVSLMLANNETGAVQPVAAAAEICHRHGALLHCDAVQAFGKMEVDVAGLGVDLLSISAHKLGGPQGSGALVLRPGLEFASQIKGGGQERRRRAGTENVAAIAGFAAAAQAAVAALQDWRQMDAWRLALEEEIRDLCPKAKIYGAETARLPNTTCVLMPGVSAETQVVAFDLAGVAISAGSACSSGKVAPSHVLRAMGASEEEARSAIRISSGWATARADLVRALEVWREIYRRNAESSAA
ncbi:MAG: cysteine desulfurase family protein [Rhodovibrionaceae bacterium]